ncbi:MAG: zinc ribbon domain-containing protein [Propionibacteriaceae bacterium]|nr:zinc ribbon domain-containing protein [Propionibacteriaceae bacterium]
MPTYQYRCKACGEELEAVQQFSDPALTTCPACSGELRKVYNAVGVVFKGSGFYATDSRKQPSTSKPAASESTTSTKTKEPATASTAPAKTDS